MGKGDVLTELGNLKGGLGRLVRESNVGAIVGRRCGACGISDLVG